MGAACSGQRIPHEVLLTGPQGSGKTTLLYFWCLNEPTKPAPTISFNVELVRALGGATLLFWDVSDPGRRRQFYHGSEALVYVFGGSSCWDGSAVLADLKLLLSVRDLRNLPLLLVHSQHDEKEPPETAGIQDILKEIDHHGPHEYIVVRKEAPQTYTDALDKLCDILQLLH